VNFNSPQYLLFLPIVLIGFLLVRRHERWRDLWLLVASYFFYMSWNWKYAGLIGLSTLLDYTLALLMARQERPAPRKLLLTISLCSNLGLLCLFKYYNFFVDTVAAAVGADPTSGGWLHVHLLLPVGISFYTFQSLSYTVDVYRRHMPPERSLLKFALFVAFFPQLVAGPIVRAIDFIPQLHREPQQDSRGFNRGLALIFQGLFKKVIIADLLATLGVDAVFADPTSFSSLDLMLALYGYAFQIYCDFSGYSDVAIGSAALFGYDLTLNFRRPYLAENVRDFWSRWHISLSTWLRDYLYIPLGSNRRGAWRTRVNLLVTMLLGGLWHGAAMNFVLWGLYHGVLLIGSHARNAQPQTRGNIWLRRIVCFHLICGGWLLFRVSDMATLAAFLRGVSQLTLDTRLKPLYLGVLALAIVLHVMPAGLIERLRHRLADCPAPVQAAVYTALLLIFSGAAIGAPSFIYFQF
jgi:D-alanyl-lipoteichoic acid acyltransferase DltB (MBOAT superfamily)